MTYISRKSRLLVPRWFDECEPSYLYWVNRRKSDGRLKRHTSCDDLRAWVDDEYLNYQYFLEVMTDGENYQPFLGVIGRFIPVEAILDFLCGNFKTGEDVKQLEQDNQQRRQRANNEFDPKDTLRLLSSAMAKLESIQCIIRASEDDRDVSTCDESGSSVSGRDFICSKRKESLQNRKRSVSNFRSRTSTIGGENINEEDYTNDCSETLKKISCLKSELSAIQKKKEELKKEKDASRSTMSSSSQGIKELYRKNDQMHRRKIQMKIEECNSQKKPVLNQTYQTLKHFNDLKKVREHTMKSQNNQRKNFRVSQCSDNEGFPSSAEDKSSSLSYDFRKFSRSKDMDKGTSEWLDKNFDARNRSLSYSIRASDSNEGSSNNEKPKSVSFDKGYTKTYPCPRRKRDPKNTGLGFSRNVEEVSSLNTNTISSVLLSNNESQKTYNVSSISQNIPCKKFKSETSMAEIEQALRSYEKRLRNLNYLEDQVDMLKKKAAMANMFRKMWMHVCAKSRSQKAADMKKTGQLCVENSMLRKTLQRMVTKSKKKQMKMLKLRCRQTHMEEVTRDLKLKLNEYEITCNNQRNYICTLETKVSIQKSEIEKLMSQITKMFLVSERLKGEEKSMKKNIHSNCFYYSKYAESGEYEPRRTSVMMSSDEEISNVPYYCCCNVKNSDRQISESERRGNDQECPGYSRGKCSCN